MLDLVLGQDMGMASHHSLEEGERGALEPGQEQFLKGKERVRTSVTGRPEPARLLTIFLVMAEWRSAVVPYFSRMTFSCRVFFWAAEACCNCCISDF